MFFACFIRVCVAVFDVAKVDLKPLSYVHLLRALNDCYKVLTDSGGLQVESYWIKKPCITIRPQTEWIATLKGDWNVLADPTSLPYKIRKIPDESLYDPSFGGNGSAADFIAKTIKDLRI